MDKALLIQLLAQQAPTLLKALQSQGFQNAPNVMQALSDQYDPGLMEEFMEGDPKAIGALNFTLDPNSFKTNPNELYYRADHTTGNWFGVQGMGRPSYMPADVSQQGMDAMNYFADAAKYDPYRVKFLLDAGYYNSR